MNNLTTLVKAAFLILLISTILVFDVSAVEQEMEAHSEASAADRLLSAEEIAGDVAIAREVYQRIHPGYERYTDPRVINAAWDRVVSDAAESGMTLGDFYLRVSEVLALVRCDHTKAELPKPLADARKVQPLYLPFSWELVEGRALVTKDYRSADGSVSLERGVEIVSIDGRTIDDMVQELDTYIPVDGFTDQVKPIYMAASAEHMGGAVDHFGALLWDPSPVARLQVLRLNGVTEDLEVARINFTQWEQLAEKDTPRDFKNAVYFERIGDSAAYLRVDTFVNYRDPVDPDEIYKPIFKALSEEGRTELILDLRNNGGGSHDAQSTLMAYLIKEKTRIVKDTRAKTLDLDGIRQYLWTWDKDALDPNWLAFRKNNDGSYSLRDWVNDDTDIIKPKRDAFKGKLVALTSLSNSSGSTIFLAKLKGLGRATLVGEETGGSAEGPTAGILFYLTLPSSGIRTRVPALRSYVDIDEFEFGKGVTPDLYAPMTAAALIAGRDPALERAKIILSE